MFVNLYSQSLVMELEYLHDPTQEELEETANSIAEKLGYKQADFLDKVQKRNKNKKLYSVYKFNLIRKEKKEAGSKGGKKTLEKYGRNHYSTISKKGWENRRKNDKTNQS